MTDKRVILLLEDGSFWGEAYCPWHHDKLTTEDVIMVDVRIYSFVAEVDDALVFQRVPVRHLQFRRAIPDTNILNKLTPAKHDEDDRLGSEYMLAA
jgi:hypothetical protein